MTLFLLLLIVTLTLASHADAIDPATYFDTILTPSETEGYTTWLSSLPAPYPMHTFMPTDNNDDGAAVFWNLDEENKEVHFAIAVHAEGWVGLGVSEAGGMIGSDIALFESSSPEEVIDSYVVEDRIRPLVDTCQDWNLTDATVQDGWIIIEVRRLLDTQDSQDHPIVNDVELWSAPTRLIAAWGDGEMASYHGNSKARSSVRLFANSVLSESVAFEKLLDEESDGYFEVHEDNYLIPAEETTYHDFCKTFDELNIDQSGGISMVGAMPVMTEETRRFIHHFTVYVAPSCGAFAFPRSMIYVWAPGDSGWALPSNVGFPIFHNTNSQAINVEIHYNNPSEETGVLDSSGVRFYYVNEERDEMAAILELGDPLLMLESEPINSGLTKYQFTCPGECSANIGGGSVTVLNEFLHMHQTGVRMTNEVVRGEEVVHTSSVDVYDFEQQGGFHVPQEPFELRPGDGFRTTCYYRDGDKFGLDSDEEMCIAFIMYYPAKEKFGNPWMCPYGDAFEFLSALGCDQELKFYDLDSVGELERAFGASNECAVDSHLLSPTASPITDQPTNSARPTIDIKMCSVCSDGITADSDSVIPGAGGATCASLISTAQATMLEGTDSCENMKGVEPLCCPTPADSPCNFCPSGLSAGNTFLQVPGADGATCSDLTVYAATIESESYLCESMKGAEPLCCPAPVDSPCNFCPDKVSSSNAFLEVPGADGATCSDLTVYAATIESESDSCEEVKEAEPLCCPPPVDSPCNFCSDEVSASNALLEVPGADGATCGDLVVYAAALENESDICSDIMMAEVLCCPEEDAATMTCSFCKNGVTVDPEYVIPFAPNGETCGYLNEVAPTLESDSEFCPQIQAAEPVCCPPIEVIEDNTPATGPAKLCNFCSNEVSASNTLLEVPGADGATCGDLVVYAAALENESDVCSDIVMAEPLCCPEEDAATMTCSFCKNGMTVDSEYVIPFSPNGETCGYLNELASTLESDSDVCPQIQAAEPVCCPPIEVIEATAPPTGSPKLSSTPSPLGLGPNNTSPGVVDGLDGPSVGAVANDMKFTLILTFVPLVYAMITLW